MYHLEFMARIRTKKQNQGRDLYIYIKPKQVENINNQGPSLLP